MFDLPPPAPAIEINLASRGISKGLAQTEGPQALVRGEVAFGAAYAGAYAKNVTSSTAKGEAGALIGFRTKAGGLDLAASAAWKRAIDPAPGSDVNGLEIAGSVARRVGRLTPRLSVVWSPDDVGSTERTWFTEAGASYRIGKAVTASAALGRRERSGGDDYTAWNAGIAWAVHKNFTADLRYYDTDNGGEHPYKARVVVSARAKF